MNYIAIIPARKGSKEIPGKNIKSLAGKPLIVWSIEQALRSTRISRVIVSTDCNQIAEISKKSGAEVPFLRPNSISQDLSTVVPGEWEGFQKSIVDITSPIPLKTFNVINTSIPV